MRHLPLLKRLITWQVAVLRHSAECDECHHDIDGKGFTYCDECWEELNEKYEQLKHYCCLIESELEKIKDKNDHY